MSLILFRGTLKYSQNGIFADMLIGYLSPNVDKTQRKMILFEADPPPAWWLSRMIVRIETKPEADSHPNAIISLDENPVDQSGFCFAR